VTTARPSIWCACGAVAAWGLAVASAFHGYHPESVTYPNGEPTPVEFWPLIILAVVLAVAAFMARPRVRTEGGGRSGADQLALLVVIAVPIAALVTVFIQSISYSYWE
jgi:H+/Cl- antiporter ClcA